jgi:hypothetical protein
MQRVNGGVIGTALVTGTAEADPGAVLLTDVKSKVSDFFGSAANNFTSPPIGQISLMSIIQPVDEGALAYPSLWHCDTLDGDYTLAPTINDAEGWRIDAHDLKEYWRIGYTNPEEGLKVVVGIAYGGTPQYA